MDLRATYSIAYDVQGSVLVDVNCDEGAQISRSSYSEKPDTTWCSRLRKCKGKRHIGRLEGVCDPPFYCSAVYICIHAHPNPRRYQTVSAVIIRRRATTIHVQSVVVPFAP